MTTAEKSVQVEGFQVTWHFQDDDLIVEMQAPTTGWVALGFNPVDDIVGSNLIMGGVINGELKLEDQFVTAVGQHPSVDLLGGVPSAFPLGGSEADDGTTVKFKISQQTQDKYHYDLRPGTIIYLICAYSLSDDFEHHSVMRKHIKVKL